MSAAAGSSLSDVPRHFCRLLGSSGCLLWMNESSACCLPHCSEDQGLFPGKDLPVYTRDLNYGSPQHPIR